MGFKTVWYQKFRKDKMNGILMINDNKNDKNVDNKIDANTSDNTNNNTSDKIDDKTSDKIDDKNSDGNIIIMLIMTPMIMIPYKL